METCGVCSAGRHGDVAFCWRCGSAPPTPEETASLLEEVAGETRLRWKPDLRHQVKPLKRYSAWYGGPLSFPPAAKIGLTIFTIMAVAFFLLHANSPGSGLIMAPYGFAVIWAIWRRSRIR